MAEREGTFKMVNIPSSLHSRVEKRLPKTSFSTVDEYVSFLIREVLNTVESEEKEQGKDFTPEEEKEVEARLRKLGYID